MFNRTGISELCGRSNIYFLPSLDKFTLPKTYNSHRCVVLCDPRVLQFHANALACFEDKRSYADFIVLDGHEPDAIRVEAIAERARGAGAEVVLSIGGGSTMDTGKGLCQLLRGQVRLPTTFERPGKFDLASPHLVFPTTSGPGAEVSPAMVFTGALGRKLAVVDQRLIPRHVYVVPALLATLPTFETACCLFDGLAHAMEAALRPDCTPAAHIASTSALRGFLTLMHSVCEDPSNLCAREQLAMLSIWSGEGLRMSAVGAVHALAGTLTEVQPAPHGLQVAAALMALLWEGTDGSAHLGSLAMQLGFDGQDALVGELSDCWQRYVACGANQTWQPSDSMVSACTVALMDDQRVNFHWSSIDAGCAERAVRRALSMVRTTQERRDPN